MKILLIFLSLTCISFVQSPPAHIKDGNVPVEKSEPLPATIEIAGADAKLITAARVRLELVQLRARNYQLEIEKQLDEARKNLVTLEKSRDDEQQKWQTMISAIAKVPTDKLDGYTMTEKDGKWTLNRKAPQP